MKMLLVSEENVAKAVAKTMNHYFKEVDAEAITFEPENYHKSVAKLEKAIADNTDKEILILVDVFGSVAYIEARVALEKFGVDEDSALIICGLSVPMAVKLHNFKEMVSVQYIRTVYEEHDRLGYSLPIRKIRKSA